MSALPRNAARPASGSLMRAAIAGLLLLAGLALYVLRLDEWAGLIGDDAWYVVLAKSLAAGSGARMINAPGAAVVSQVYPPGWPALLSLMFHISPEFPANLILLKSLSVAAMLGAGALTYRYATTYRQLTHPIAIGVAVATIMTPALVFLATSTLMSEAVFTLVQLVAVLRIDRAARVTEERRGRRAAVLAGVVAAAALLIRTAGITVGAAGLLYLLRKRLWWRAAAFGAAIAICCMPWWVYSRANAPTTAELIEHGGLMAIPYADQFWTSVAGEITSRRIGAHELPARVALNLANIASRDVGGIIVPTLFRTPGESGLEVIGLGPPEKGLIPRMGGALGTKVVSLVLSALIVCGLVTAWRQHFSVADLLVVLSLAMIAAWPFWTFRFVLPLAPFLLCYLVLGTGRLATWLVSLGRADVLDPQPIMRILVLTLIGLHGWDHARYIVQARDPARRDGMVWRVTAEEIHALTRWLTAHAAPDTIVASDNPALVHILTGHRTVAMDSVGDDWARWSRLGVRYVVCVNGREPLTDRPGFTIRFILPHQNMWVAEIVAADGVQSVASATHRPERAVRYTMR